jgi:AcrR family transcriptional regulator
LVLRMHEHTKCKEPKKCNSGGCDDSCFHDLFLLTIQPQLQVQYMSITHVLLLAFVPHREIPRDMVKTLDPYRRRPRQERSAATVAAIFEATARILHTRGGAELNTNAIAELAGVSIGTLYQYFPDKNAILIALARQELDKSARAALASVEGKQDDAATDPARAVVRVLLRAFGGRQRTRKILIETLIGNGLSDELANPVEAVARAILEHQEMGRDGRSRKMTPLRVFVMTRAVIGAIRAAVMEQSQWLNTQAFEDELVELVLRLQASA